MGPLTCLFQDTVVALHALSRYGAATFTRSGKAAQVTIQSSGTFSTKFQVENSNRLLLQQVSLPEVPGEYSISVTGEGCVYLQVRFCRQKVQSHHGHWKVLTQQMMGQIKELGKLGGVLEKGKSQIFICSTDIFEIQCSPEKRRVPICFGGTDSAPNLWWTQSPHQLPDLTECQVRPLTASCSSGYNSQSSH